MAETAEVFARRLREERVRRGVTQAALAEALSATLGRAVYPSAVALMEKGDRAVRLDEALAAASYLGVELSELVRERSAADERAELLRAALEKQQSRAAAAEHEHQQAQLEMIAIEQELAELESGRSE